MVDRASTNTTNSILFNKRKIVGDRKQTIYKLLGPKTVQYLNRLGDKNEINYYD